METPADIVAEIRAAAHIHPQSVLRLADRIEEAVKREHEEAATTINALEDAIDYAIYSLNRFNKIGDGRIHFIDILCVSNAKGALQACRILYAAEKERKVR